MTPDVSVIVLCRNEIEDLRACLEVVLAQSFPGRVDVLVVDTASTDGTADMVRRLPVRLIEIRQDEFHHARTRNMAAGRCEAPVLAFVSAHARPIGERWLETLVDALTEDVAGAYGRQIARDDAYPMERFMLEELYGPEARLQSVPVGTTPGLADTLFSTANAVLWRRLWAERGFSDTVAMSEDQEWSRYWLERGNRFAYVPEAVVVHSHNHGLRQVFQRHYDSGVSASASYLSGGAGASLRFAADGVGYLAREAAYLVRTGEARWLPYALLHEGAKMTGLALGRFHRVLPSGVHRRLRSLS